MEFKSIATAPGKAILFGEHAVVYGTTAVAASLSDMRIKVETVSNVCVHGPGRLCTNARVPYAANHLTPTMICFIGIYY
jgi:hypothetical protein